MSGKLSSLKSTVSLGSGAVSHVYVQNPPLRCNIPRSRDFYYDDGNKLLLSPATDQIFSWKTVPFSPNAAPMADSISEGPILSIRFSLDEKLIAVQRSNSEIQFWHRETGETFTHSCKSESESVLGFFWTDCQSCDIVIVKTSGLDLLAYDSAAKSLILVDTKKMNVSWYVYTHESRLVLLASGMQCKTFNGFQLSSAGIVRLPKFEMVMAKSDSNSKPILASEDVYIVTVYGRIYCLQVDRVSMQLHSYRFYRDAVVQQGSLPVYSSKVAVSVVDNVLLVHQVDAKVVILYDIFVDSRAPISAPLPILVRGLRRSNSSTSRYNSLESEGSEGTIANDTEAIVHGDDWIFLVPDLIFDIVNKCLWKIQLDLEAISASCSEVPSILEFLQRRKLEAHKSAEIVVSIRQLLYDVSPWSIRHIFQEANNVLRSWAKQLCLAITRTIILERRPVSMVAKAVDVLVTSYSHSLRTGSYFKGMNTTRISSSSPNVRNPSSGTDLSTSRVDGLGKSVKPGSTASAVSESANRSSNLSASDSEENATFGTSKSGSNEAQAAENLGGNSVIGSENRSSEARPSSLQDDQHPSPSSRALNVNVFEQQELQLSSPAISPDEMYRFVFSLVEEEIIGERSYLVAIILEFLHSANSEKVKLQPNIYVLTIQLLARSQRYAELGLFVINKIIEPSKEVALQLLESGRQNVQTRKLGLDMLRQLSLHHDYVLLLVQDGYYLEALHYVRKHKVTSVRPSLFLEAAFAANNSQHLAAVLRFYSEFNPGFRDTSDFYTYCHVLNEMGSSVAA